MPCCCSAQPAAGSCGLPARLPRQKATDGIKGAIAKLFSDANLVTNTAPTWTYQQAAVVKLRDAMVLVANAAVGLLIFWMGLNIALRPYFGEGYPDLREALLLCAGERVFMEIVATEQERLLASTTPAELAERNRQRRHQARTVGVHADAAAPLTAPPETPPISLSSARRVR